VDASIWLDTDALPLNDSLMDLLSKFLVSPDLLFLEFRVAAVATCSCSGRSPMGGHTSLINWDRLPMASFACCRVRTARRGEIPPDSNRELSSARPAMAGIIGGDRLAERLRKPGAAEREQVSLGGRPCRSDDLNSPPASSRAG
jgi:hypothetical protein